MLIAEMLAIHLWTMSLRRRFLSRLVTVGALGMCFNLGMPLNNPSNVAMTRLALPAKG
jgi:hypothetical protein